MRAGLQDEHTPQAFEVEDIRERKNYTLKYIPNNMVCMIDTSRNGNKKVLSEFPEDTHSEFTTPFPFDCKTAYEYFVHMYNKALNTVSTGIVFLGWVDIHTYEPIEE